MKICRKHPTQSGHIRQHIHLTQFRCLDHKQHLFPYPTLCQSQWLFRCASLRIDNGNLESFKRSHVSPKPIRSHGCSHVLCIKHIVTKGGRHVFITNNQCQLLSWFNCFSSSGITHKRTSSAAPLLLKLWPIAIMLNYVNLKIPLVNITIVISHGYFISTENLSSSSSPWYYIQTGELLTSNCNSGNLGQVLELSGR